MENPRAARVDGLETFFASFEKGSKRSEACLCFPALEGNEAEFLMEATPMPPPREAGSLEALDKALVLAGLGLVFRATLSLGGKGLFWVADFVCFTTVVLMGPDSFNDVGVA